VVEAGNDLPISANSFWKHSPAAMKGLRIEFTDPDRPDRNKNMVFSANFQKFPTKDE